MFLSRKNGDYEPVAWVGGHPLYASAILTVLHVLTLIVAALLFACGVPEWLSPFKFSSYEVLHRAEIWQCVTYVFVHEPMDTIGFLIEMAVLFFWGREVERFIGQRGFLLMYGWLILAAPVVLIPAGLFGYSTVRLGSSAVHFGVFLAFATLYPSAELIFRLQARWIAWALLGIFTIADLAGRQWLALTVLWINAAVAWGSIGWIRGTLTFPRFPRLSLPMSVSKQAEAVPHAPLRRFGPKAQPAAEDPMLEIDPLLDKIAVHGMESLTSAEREKLERARKQLLRKDGGSKD